MGVASALTRLLGLTCFVNKAEVLKVCIYHVEIPPGGRADVPTFPGLPRLFSFLFF